MGIRRRIVLSFLAFFALFFVAMAALSTFLVARAVENRLEAQTRNLALLVDGMPEGMLAGYLDRLRELHGAEALRVGKLSSGTFPGDASGRAVFRAPTRGKEELVVVYSAEVVSNERARAVEPFVVLAVPGLLLVVVLGLFTAQAIARPIERLAAQARALPGGDVAPVGGGAELDHLVEALNRMLSEVRRAERLAVMGKMAAGVAHEIRNPLSSMKMTVQMLRDAAQDREPYDLLLREVERLELTAAELSGASQPLRQERVELDGVVDDVLELMRPRLEHLSIRVARQRSPGAMVSVDVSRFKRCIMNLVLNGAQAMPSGGDLSVEVAARDGGVRLSVTDAGDGMPAELRATVFEPFVTTKQHGVGLGLALTRRIVEDHGGKIGFQDEERGMTFWIELPHG